MLLRKGRYGGWKMEQRGEWMTMEASVRCFCTGMLYRAGQGQARQVTHTKYSKQVKFGNGKARCRVMGPLSQNVACRQRARSHEVINPQWFISEANECCGRRARYQNAEIIIQLPSCCDCSRLWRTMMQSFQVNMIWQRMRACSSLQRQTWFNHKCPGALSSPPHVC